MKKKVISLLLAAALLSCAGCAENRAHTPDTAAGTTVSRPGVTEETLQPGGTATDNSGTNATGGAEMAPAYWDSTTDFGIVVDGDGVMRLAGKPVYMAGVNCYNLFNQCFDGFSAEKAKQTLRVLKENGVSVIRFNCGGYSYEYIRTYYENPDAYLSLLREIVSCAEELEIGLIPSFFWLKNAVPDYFDEPLRSWGRADSQTVEFLCSYTAAVVSTIKDSKAVFAWEFGNEFNLGCDLPNVTEHLPALPPHSTRTERTEEDYLSAVDVSYALTRFAETIHSLDDTGRMITSGNATLRPSQYHQLTENTWAQDSYEEYTQITAMFTPEGVDTISEHVYFTAQQTFGRELSLWEYLGYATQSAKEQKKAYFVGEWGGGSSTDMWYYQDIGNTFVDAGVQLCLLWNFNLEEDSVEYSFSAESNRGQKLLTVLAGLNKRYRTEYGFEI